jgi:CspA family cold shock protein
VSAAADVLGTSTAQTQQRLTASRRSQRSAAITACRCRTVRVERFGVRNLRERNQELDRWLRHKQGLTSPEGWVRFMKRWPFVLGAAYVSALCSLVVVALVGLVWFPLVIVPQALFMAFQAGAMKAERDRLAGDQHGFGRIRPPGLLKLPVKQQISTTATVRSWDDSQGWGVLDSDATQGGCWTHFSALDFDGYRALAPGQQVRLEAESPGQDGYAWRAVRVTVDGRSPASLEPHDGDGAMSRSTTSRHD